jgi:hypothetical protein
MPAKKATNKITKKSSAKEETDEIPQEECEHCEGRGKCSAGEPYDPGHHQSFAPKIRLTSCIECLEAAGEHHNSKKLVVCHVCGGTGKVPA